MAGHVTTRLRIPTIGIGAGRATSGQVLVLADLLGLQEDLRPRFVKRYAGLGVAARAAVAAFRDDVRERRFPAAEHAYDLPDEEWNAYLAAAGEGSPSAALHEV